MKLFENYKTKKQLREEINQLKQDVAFANGMNRIPILRVEKNLIEIGASVVIDERYLGIPIDYAKREIVRKIANRLADIIKYDIEDNSQINGKTLVGTIRVEVDGI